MLIEDILPLIECLKETCWQKKKKKDMGMKEGKGEAWAGKNRFAYPASCRESSNCPSTADILGSEILCYLLEIQS